jgi:hypothetical protein
MRRIGDRALTPAERQARRRHGLLAELERLRWALLLASLPLHEPRDGGGDLAQCAEQEHGEGGVLAVGGEDDGVAPCESP